MSYLLVQPLLVTVKYRPVIGEVSVEDLLDLHVQQNLSRLLLHNQMAESWQEKTQRVRGDLQRRDWTSLSVIYKTSLLTISPCFRSIVDEDVCKRSPRSVVPLPGRADSFGSFWYSKVSFDKVRMKGRIS